MHSNLNVIFWDMKLQLTFQSRYSFVLLTSDCISFCCVWSCCENAEYISIFIANARELMRCKNETRRGHILRALLKCHHFCKSLHQIQYLFFSACCPWGLPRLTRQCPFAKRIHRRAQIWDLCNYGTFTFWLSLLICPSCPNKQHSIIFINDRGVD